MKLLLHICCAPCSVACIKQLRADGIEPVGFWYNPNIHPVTEYRARRDCLVEYAESIGLELVVEDSYGLRPFVQAVCDDIDNRCAHCYSCRLERTAQYAVEHGFDAFTTTLSISPYQNFELICQQGKKAGAEHDVPFLPLDFRPVFREGQNEARALGLYMQKYCGCIFSEEERYCKIKKSS
ncbi:MAG: epoxyqueuosine reductase QueH [Oscillospiraceae bacterium]|nr:epoxyqueuosine reductase QueH [Oscillospiraceae bacterium]